MSLTANTATAHAAVEPHTSWINILTILAAGTASFIFGYSNNVIAGTLAQASFLEKFLTVETTPRIGGMLGAFFGGAWIGCVIQSPVSSRFGRRPCNMAAAVIVTIAAALQAGSVDLGMFLVARVLNGIGAGMIIANTPVYMSEIAPAHTRGILVSCQGVAVTFAYIVSSLIAFGFHFVNHPFQWRLQFIVLTSLSLLLVVAMYFIPESPRWLMDHGRPDEAWRVLQRLHSSKKDPDARLARAEYVQIKAQIEEEKSLPSGYWYILTNPHMRKRAICGSLVWIMGQSTGIVVIANFAPQLFAGLGFDNELQLGLAVVWVTVCAIGTWLSGLLIERLGRVKQLALGGYLCTACLIIEAVLQKYYIGSSNSTGLNSATAMYFIFVFLFGLLIECPGYTYIVEIWPTHLRSEGATIGFVSFFTMTIIYNSPAAGAFATIGWRYYFVMISVCLVSTTALLFYCPETAGLTLEEVAAKFGDHVAVDMSTIDIDHIEIEKTADAHVERIGA
ncbi:general substrate transporter [Exophiala viscosa]|uniref:General substrate transporter n=1 Tax=Exophiala viscosa TaxID=2486360 RepID=A0AAN6E7F0_9EURO|nr:general substrate transporter [Exophiala viscosa]